MAKFGMYAMYDRVSEEFSPPFIARNDAVAVREMLTTMQNSPYPDDFYLQAIGTYDSMTGEVKHLEHKIVPFSLKAKIDDVLRDKLEKEIADE